MNELLLALKSINRDGPRRLDRGICINVLYMTGKSYKSDLFPLFRQWPEYSGIDEVPINGSYSDAILGGYMWDKGHPYGQARWRLLNHLIDILEKRNI